MRLQIPGRFFSLRFKIVVSFILVTVLSSALIGFYSYYNARANIEKAVGESAMTIIKSIENTIDSEKFKQLKSQKDMQTEYYKELQGHLNKIMNETGLKYLYTMRKTEDGKYIYVVDGTEMNDEDFSSLGDEEKDVTGPLKASFIGEEGYGYDSDDWGNFISAYIPIKDKSGAVVGILGADFDADSVITRLAKFRTNIIIINILVVIAAFIISEIISFLLVRSLRNLKQQAEVLKDGDLTVKLNSNSRDETGILADVFKEMAANLLSIIKEIKRNTLNVFNEIEALHSSFSDTSRATEEIAQIVNEIAAGTVQQTNGVQEVSNSMNEVFTQVKSSAGHANLVLDISSQAALNASKAIETFKTSIDKVVDVNNTVAQTADIIMELGEKSKEIGIFSETISNITKQTKLLSLNASIEAARAGEHGKGFAVVADQVKILSEQSNEASRQISEISGKMQAEINNAIRSIQDGVIQANEGVSAVKNVDESLFELQKSSNASYGKAGEILQSILSIEEDCKNVLKKVYQLADISQSFSTGSQQAAASTQEQNAVMQQIRDNLNNVKSMTNSLNNVTSRFKVE